MTQLELRATPPAPKPPPTLEERFAAFHAANPHVFAALVALARHAKAAGKRVGMKALWERLRWEFDVEGTERSPKLNNDYTALFARLIEQQCPDLNGFFEKRKRASP